MNPLVITLTFLSLIGILTSSELIEHHQSEWSHHILLASLEQKKEESDALQTALFEQLHDERLETPNQTRPHRSPSKTTEAKPPRTPKLRYDLSRPPNNSRLNFALILQDQDPFWYETAAALMRHLYSTQFSFCSHAHVEYKILDALIRQQELARHFMYPDDLGSLDLGDQELQKLFYQMLKGDIGPSLLHFITYDTVTTRSQKKLNLLFAPHELLTILFPRNSADVERLVQEIWEDILSSREESLTRTEIRQQLMHRFETLCSHSGIPLEETKKKFDFTLGKSGTILFTQDLETGVTHRTKLPLLSQR